MYLGHLTMPVWRICDRLQTILILTADRQSRVTKVEGPAMMTTMAQARDTGAPLSETPNTPAPDSSGA